MTTEEKRVKIAEACGVQPVCKWERDWQGQLQMVAGSEDWSDAPFYFNDLNACHEMEKHLRLTDRAAYWTYGKKLDGLVAIYNSEDDRTQEECIGTFEAPASMRAEAFYIVCCQRAEDRPL